MKIRKDKINGAGRNIPAGTLLLISYFILLTSIPACGRRADPVYVPAHDQKRISEEAPAPKEKVQEMQPEAPPDGGVKGTAVPDAPEGLVGLFTGRSVVLTWQEVRGQGVKAYRIYRSSGNAFELAGESPTPAFTDRNIAQGFLYRYYVTAVGEAEGPPGDEIGILTEVE